MANVQKVIQPVWDIFSKISQIFGDESYKSANALNYRIKQLPTALNTVEDAPLIAHHNLTEEGVKATDRLGGIPMPSLGVSRADDPLENFGEISLIANPKRIDPAKDPSMSIYSADAYTGRQPKGTYGYKKDDLMYALEADPQGIFNHIAVDAADALYNFEPHEADLAIKIIQGAVEESVKDGYGIKPTNFANFSDLYDAAISMNNHPYGSGLKGNGLEQYIKPDYYLPYPNENKKYTLRSGLNAMRQGREGPAYTPASEEYNSGAGAFRAAFLEPYGSLQEVADARGKISIDADIPDEIKPFNKNDGPIAKIYESNRQLQMDLFDDLENSYQKTIDKSVWNDEKGAWDFVPTKNRMPRRDSEEFMKAIIKGEDASSTMAVQNGYIPESEIPKITEALEELRPMMNEMPSSYAEIKPNSAMKLSDFEAAVIPSDLANNAEIMEIFKKENIPVHLYDDYGSGGGKTRKEVMRNLNEYLFSVPLAGTVGYGALQGVGEEDG